MPGLFFPYLHLLPHGKFIALKTLALQGKCNISARSSLIKIKDFTGSVSFPGLRVIYLNPAGVVQKQ